MPCRLLHIVCSVVLLLVALPVSAQTPLCKDTAEHHRLQQAMWDATAGQSAEKVDTIFEPFTKGDEFKQGLGLGLAYCHETAEKLGGSLVFDKNYHEGASFILTLPINLTQK